MRLHDSTLEIERRSTTKKWWAGGWLWRLCARFPVPPRFHVAIYRLTGGLIGSRFPLGGLDVLLLTTTGRVTGKARTTPVVFFRHGESLIIVASNRGTQRYPLWYWNLQCQPEAMIQVRRTKQPVIAREARMIEHETLWPLLRGKLPVFDLYQRRTPRHLPVIVLCPTLPPGSGDKRAAYRGRREL